MRWFRQHTGDAHRRCRAGGAGTAPAASCGAAAPAVEPAPAPPTALAVATGTVDTAVRRNVGLRAGDRMFRIGQFLASGTDPGLGVDGLAHLAALHRAVQRVLELHSGDALDGTCTGCGPGRGRRRPPWPTPVCPTRRTVLRALSEEDDRG